MKNQKLLFIASYSYSGSTLLDILIGGNKDVFSAGEIFAIGPLLKSPDNWRDKNCTCGVGMNDCRIWNAVIERMKSEWNDSCGDNDVILPKLNRMGIFYPKFKDTSDVSCYDEATEKIFNTIREVAKVNWVVDSSKNVPRMKLLIESKRYSLKIIVLKRRFFDVMTSVVKRKQGLFRHMVGYFYYYYWIKRLCDTVESDMVINVDFSDLVDDPELTLKRICNWMGITYSEQMCKLDENEYHLLGGNMDTMAGRFGGIRH